MTLPGIRRASGKSLKVFAAALIAVIAIFSWFSLLTASAQSASQPRCSFKIGDGDFLDDIPQTVDIGSRIFVKCRIELGHGGGSWKGRTELDQVDWQINGGSIHLGREIEIDETAAAVVEMEGVVPSYKDSIRVSDREEEFYMRDVAKSRTIRVVEFGQDDRFDYRRESIALHWVAHEVNDRIAKFRSDGDADALTRIAPLLDFSFELVEEGRPWDAQDILDATQPMIAESLTVEPPPFWGEGVSYLIVALPVLILGCLVTFAFTWMLRGSGSRNRDNNRDDDMDDDLDDLDDLDDI